MMTGTDGGNQGLNYIPGEPWGEKWPGTLRNGFFSFPMASLLRILFFVQTQIPRAKLLPKLEVPKFRFFFFREKTPTLIRIGNRTYKSSYSHQSYMYITSTLNIDLILWHTQLIVCAENIKSWGFPFTFQAYILPHTLNCMCVSLYILISYQNFGAFLVLPKTAGSAQAHKSMSFN